MSWVPEFSGKGSCLYGQVWDAGVWGRCIGKLSEVGGGTDVESKKV